MVPGVTRGALKTILMVGAGLYLVTEILKELAFSQSLNGKNSTISCVFVHRLQEINDEISRHSYKQRSMISKVECDNLYNHQSLFVK